MVDLNVMNGQLPPTVDSDLLKKVVFVGDVSVGKSSLIEAKVKGRLPGYHLSPTSASENRKVHVQYDGNTIVLDIWDTGGFSAYEKLRAKTYPGCCAVVIVFNRDRSESLKHVTEYWIREVRQSCPHVPVILVGSRIMDPFPGFFTGSEIIHYIQPRPVTLSQAEAAATKIGASHYFECCAQTGEGVTDLFEAIARACCHPDEMRFARGYCQRCSMM